jgi:hypothetical protein
MAAATLDQILTSLNGVYQPQIQSVQQQQAALPAQFDAQTQGVEAQKNDAFNSILNGARARGTGVAFGGIPLQEQAQYTASTYAPALAKLQSDQLTQQQSLQDALNKINEDKMNTANGMYQFGVNQDLEQQKLAEQQREFDAQQAAAARASAASSAGLGSLFAGYGTSGGQSQPAAQQPQYIGNNDLRGHLNYLAQKENNQDAAVALHYVGNDGKYNLNPYVTNPAILAALSRIGATNVWKSAPSVATIAPSKAPSKSTNQYGGGNAGLGALGF